MKLSRRGFFGAAAVAPVVGKSAVADAIKSGGASRGYAIGGSLSGFAPAVDASDDYVKQLERAARGVFSDDDVFEWRMYDMHTCCARAANIDALRSVSPAVKFTLMAERELEVTKQQRRWRSLRELIRMGKFI